MAIDQPQTQGLVSEEAYQAALNAPEVEKNTRLSNLVDDEEIDKVLESDTAAEAAVESDSDNEKAEEIAEQVEQVTEQAEQIDPETESSAEKESEVDSKEEEINRIVTKRLAREARKLQAVQKELDDLRNGRTNQVAQVMQEPTPEQYGGVTVEFIQARERWAIQKYEFEAKQRQEQEQVNKVVNGYKQRIADYAEKHPGFIEKISSPDLNPTPEVNQFILESEYGPHIADHFGDNPEDLDRINALPNARKFIELGKLEDRFAPKKALPKPVRQVPTPIKPSKGGSSVTSAKPLSKMSNSEFIAYRNAQELAKRKTK